jgi:hypothetical protein
MRSDEQEFNMREKKYMKIQKNSVATKIGAMILAIAPLQSFGIGCIGEWPNQICAQNAVDASVIQVSRPQTKLICLDRGHFDGSFGLDITDYKMVVSGSLPSLERELYFKPFRSFETPIAKMVCSVPTPLLDGPGTILACRSGQVSDVGNLPKQYEAVIRQGQWGLVMNVTGPGVADARNIPCQETE